MIAKSTYEGQEKRASPRAPIELRVDYKRLNSFFADYTRNIGRGGTFIATQKPLPLGTVFEFHITIPKLQSPIELRGEVSWVRGDGPEAGMGIRFVFEDEARRRAFEATVEQLMVESLGPVLSKKILGR